MPKIDTKKTWGIVQPILTVLTNLLMIGRNAGWWSKRSSVGDSNITIEGPGGVHRPGDKL
jgi:hypothetical protein